MTINNEKGGKKKMEKQKQTKQDHKQIDSNGVSPVGELLRCSFCESLRLELMSIIQDQEKQAILNLRCLSCGQSMEHLAIAKYKVKDQ